jgi:tetratricopeptide (TPR) repeat protein
MRGLSSRLSALVFIVLTMFFSGGPGKAQAQVTITSKMIIGDTVNDESLPKYTEVDDAIKRFMNRDVIAARTFLDAAKRKDPSLPPVAIMLAKMYFQAGNAIGANAELEKAASESPDDPEPYLSLADRAMAQGRLIEADALYEKALGLMAKFNGAQKRKRNLEIRARAGRAFVAQNRKNYDTAVSDLNALLKLDDQNAMAHYRLGQNLFMLQKFKEGYAEFDVAKQKDSKNLPDKNLATAVMYDQLKIPDKAQQFFERALEGNKSDANTVAQYAAWLIKSGSASQLAKAESLLADARKANPGTLELLILSGEAARMTKKLKPAEDYFVEALGIAPANSNVINQLALLLIEQAGQAPRSRAYQFAAMNAQLNNQSADAQITWAWVLFQLGRGTDAGNALNNGINLGPLSQDSQYLVAKILAEGNNVDKAKQVLKSLFDADAPGVFIYRQDAKELSDKLNK